MKIRFVVRTRMFREPLVVLQVEENIPYNYDPEFDSEPGGYITRWRDARIEDMAKLTVMEIDCE